MVSFAAKAVLVIVMVVPGKAALGLRVSFAVVAANSKLSMIGTNFGLFE